VRGLSTQREARKRLTQARKKRVLEEVRKQRQRRTIISVIVVVILVGTIGYGVYALTQSKGGGGNFPFPCLAEVTTLHVHPWVQIVINTGGSNASVPIPAAVGILDPQFQTSGGVQVATGGSCFEPMHTHDASGIIHIESAHTTDQYTLGDFFNIWKVSDPNGVGVNGNTSPIIFNGTDILGFRSGQGHTVSVFVDRGSTQYPNQNYTLGGSLPLNQYDFCNAQLGGTGAPPCSPTAGGNPYYGGQTYPYGTGHTILIYYR
jgi:hypothetical protein